MDVFQLIGLLMDLWLQNTAELKETKKKPHGGENKQGWKAGTGGEEVLIEGMWADAWEAFYRCWQCQVRCEKNRYAAEVGESVKELEKDHGEQCLQQ